MLITATSKSSVLGAAGKTDYALFQHFLKGVVAKKPETRADRLEINKANLKRIEGLYETAYDTELEYKKELAAQFEVLKFLVTNPEFEESYPLLSYDLFAARNAEGFPLLVPFSLETNIFELKNDVLGRDKLFSSERCKILNECPGIKKYFQNLEISRSEILDDKSRTTFIFKSRFSGSIPPTTRTKIREAEDNLFFAKMTPETKKYTWFGFGKDEVISARVNFQKIFIVAEVNGWEMQEIKFDPIVIGYAAGAIWLIDHFDLTPLEEEGLKLAS